MQVLRVYKYQLYNKTDKESCEGITSSPNTIMEPHNYAYLMNEYGGNLAQRCLPPWHPQKRANCHTFSVAIIVEDVMVKEAVGKARHSLSSLK